MTVPMSKWVWCGYAGHFIAARSCLLHLNTRVGDYRISTVGDYRPTHVWDNGKMRERNNEDGPEELGLNRTYETYVFRVSGDGEHGEGVVDDWGEIDSEGYNDGVAAERGHMAMCRKYARVGQA